MALTIDRCTKCGEEKPVTDFAPRKNRAKGYKSSCKVCDKVYAAEWKRQKYASDKLGDSVDGLKKAIAHLGGA